VITQQMEFKDKYFSLLEKGAKPGRYIGGEPNMVLKDLDRVQVRFALAFPDVYEIGMSHNGIRMLYHILNRIDDVYAERVFAPWVDMAAVFQSEGVPLLSLETKTPIRDFDLVGFSLQAELTYINIPYMLDLAGIPLLSQDRREGDPLICAGGPCTANPEPLADFIDFFVIGDGEDLVVEIVDLCRNARREGLKRWQLLDALAKLPGIYVPQVHQPPTPWVPETRPGKPFTQVKRRWVEALSPDFYSTKPIVPVIDIIQDRVSVEVMRGCTQGCRFCQAGYWYRPTRELNVDDVMRLTTESLKNTGNREIGLLSLSTADYSQVECLTKEMARAFSKDKVSISLPSLRADMFSVSLAENVGEVKKNGFTFAPEAGSVRMRRFINKNISNEELFQSIETAYRQGWNLVKLYFMIGLPTETDADIRELVDLIREVGRIGKKVKGGQKNVNASIGTFVPKSFTPFQWDRFEDLKVTTERLNYLKSAVRFPFARLKWHNPKEGFIEGVLSRGDRRVGRAILKAYQLGCRFDGWDEMFSFDLWMKAFEQSGVDPHFYNRDIPLNEVLPWEFIDIGVSKKFLLKERERSYEQVQTYDCKWGDCRGCGIPGNYEDIKLAEVPEQVVAESLVQLCLTPLTVGTGTQRGEALQVAADDIKLSAPLTPAGRGVGGEGVEQTFFRESESEQAGQAPSDKQMLSQYEDPNNRPAPLPVGARRADPLNTDVAAPVLPPRPFVTHYWKEGPARLLSHLNVMQLMERAMIRSEFPLRFTEGFNPHPKFATSPAIPLGMSSHSEYIQFELRGELPDDAVARMNACLIEGLVVQSIVPFEAKGQWTITQPLRATYKAWIENEQINGEAGDLAELMGRVNDLINHLSDHYKGNDFYCSSKDHERIVDLWVEGDEPPRLCFTVSVNQNGALLKPKDFFEQVLQCPPDLARKFLIVKETVSFQ
jgi:radical SAM family uncharacterized protein/radical SAM-linked protein